MEGKLIKFSSKEEMMWELKLDERKMEILKDVLEAHLEYLIDLYNDGDDLLKVMNEHPNKSYKDLKKALEDQGFHLAGHTVRK